MDELRARRAARRRVRLEGVTEQVLGELLAVAVAQAEPEEAMAPVAGPPGWTDERREAFRRYHRGARLLPGRALREVTFAVRVDDEVVGAARLAAVPGAPGELELGLWLGRAARGRGVAGAVLPVAAVRAAELGARRLVARTREERAAAVRVLQRGGFVLAADGTGAVLAVLELP